MRVRPLSATHIAFGFVELAQHIGAHVFAPVVELLLQLVLDHLALFLDDEDLAQAGGELAGDAGLQRPHHRHLVHAQANAAAGVVVQAQVMQGLAQVVVGLAAGDQTQLRVVAVEHRVVETIGPDVGQRGVPLMVHQAGFLFQRRVRPADVQAARRHVEIFGQVDMHTVGVDRHDAGRLHHLLDGLEPCPQAREATQGQPVQAQVQNLLHIAGKEHRQPAGFEDVVALVRHRGAFGHMVVARHGQHPAMPGRAGHVGVLEGVGTAVHARPLAVPDAEHAIVAAWPRCQVKLLAAPHGGGRQIFIDAGLENDVVAIQVGFRGPQGLVIRAQGRAPVATDEAGRAQAIQRIPGVLQHGQAHQGLDAAHVDAASLLGVLVVQRQVGQDLQGRVWQRRVHHDLLRSAMVSWATHSLPMTG